MPRNVRNFWITAHIDGRPIAKDGGFNLAIKVRSDGGIKDAVYIAGRALGDGTLELCVQGYEPGQQFVIKTKR